MTENVSETVKIDTEKIKEASSELNRQRRAFLTANWVKFSKGIFTKKLTEPQIDHLMRIRHDLPCNLARIMQRTGLTSSGASLLVNKLVESQVLIRKENPEDRRNLLIDASPKTKQILEELNGGLNEYILAFLRHLSPEEVQTVARAVDILSDAMSRYLPETK